MSCENKWIFYFYSGVFDGVINFSITSIVEVKCAISFIKVRKIFADEEEFVLSKLSFVEEVSKHFFVDGLIFLDKSDVLHSHFCEDHFGDIKFLDILENKNDIFLTCDFFQEFLDIHIADIISFVIF